MAVLVGLGFASGLPGVLVADTLQAWLKTANVDLPRIGLITGVVGWPYALKFIWAPLLDRYALPLLGRRRGWLVLTQVLVACAIVALGLRGPEGSLLAFGAGAFLVALFSASQDIVADAYRTDVLAPEELGAGAAVFTMGYRIGMIASGAGALFLADAGVSWSGVYALAAAAMAVGVVATLCAPEPPVRAGRPALLSDAVIVPLRAFLRDEGVAMLAFVALFKLPDVMGTWGATPFLIEKGYALHDIAAVRGVLGVIVTIAGTFAGGAIVARAGLVRSLWIFGVLHAAVNVAFCLLSRGGPDLSAMTAVLVIESFCVGLATAGFLAFLMSRCDPRFSAFQFALLTALMALSRYFATMFLGDVAARLGWTWFFAVAALSGVPSLLLLLRVRSPGGPPAT
jgi:PAT family beta-lactamase induction signal transducer AmpG